MDVAGEVPAVLPTLEFVVRAGRALAHDGEFAPFHPFDFQYPLEELCCIPGFHGVNVYEPRYQVNKSVILGPFGKSCRTPGSGVLRPAARAFCS